MHELPKELSHSLRSWRGSIYGASVRREPIDEVEYGQEDYGEKHGQQVLSPAESAVILHPSASSQSLRREQRQYGYQAVPQSQRDPIQVRDPRDPQHEGSSKKNAVAKRQVTLPPKTPASAKVSLFHQAPKISDPDPAADRLDDETTPLTKEQFYELIGMRAPDHAGQMPKELATEKGLYHTIQQQFRYVQTKYRIFAVAVYIFLGLQLLLSAIFIVLGALSSVDSHVAIAVLGAISTVIAGSIALMQGQGLPNRLRQNRNSLSNVIFEAEELYFDVIADRHVYFKDIRKLREDYLRVMEEARRNHPDSFTSAANKIASGVAPQTKGKPAVVGKAGR